MSAVLPNVVSVHDSGMERAIGELGLLMRELLGSEGVVHVAEVDTMVRQAYKVEDSLFNGKVALLLGR